MLDTMRAFALDQLSAQGEAEAVESAQPQVAPAVVPIGLGDGPPGEPDDRRP